MIPEDHIEEKKNSKKNLTDLADSVAICEWKLFPFVLLLLGA